MTSLSEVLSLIKTDAAEQIELVKSDRLLSAEGKAEQIAAIKRSANERVTATTAAEVARLRGVTAAERKRLKDAKQRQSDGRDLARQSFALQRAQMLLAGGEWEPIEVAIGDACKSGDQYMIAAWKDAMPLVRRQFARDQQTGFKVIDAAQALAEAEQQLEPVDVVQARQWLEEAERAEQEAIDAAGLVRFGAEFTGDRGLVQAIDSAMAERAAPVIVQTGSHSWVIEQPAGEAWL